MYQAPAYIPGNPWAICDRCGEQHRRHDMAKEWTGLIVCRATCRDPRPPEMTPPRLWPEGVPIPDARPIPTPIYVEPGDIEPGDL